MVTLEDLKKAAQVGEIKILTIERAKELSGKRIATIYFEFHPPHQPTVNEFVVGEIKSEFDLHPNPKSVLKEFKDKVHLIKKMKSSLEIVTEEGRRTFLRTNAVNNGVFTGPNIDHEVWFKEL